MKSKFKKAWQSRSPRDRKIIAALATIIVIVLYIALVQSAQHARKSLHTSVVSLRFQAEKLDQQALEYDHLRNAPTITRSSTDLHTLVQNRINDAGLSAALLRIDSIDADQVIVVFGALAFTDWLNWVTDLRSQYIRVDSCRIEALSTPGLVSVTATLVRASRHDIPEN